MDMPTLCGATGSERSIARLIIVIRRDERVDWGTPLTEILNHNIQLPLSHHVSYSLLSFQSFIPPWRLVCTVHPVVVNLMRLDSYIHSSVSRRHTHIHTDARTKW